MWQLVEVVWGVYLCGVGCYDAVSKRIYNWMLLIGLAILCVWMCIGEVYMPHLLQGLVLGIAFIVISFLSKERLGLGDAYIIFFLSVYFGAMEMLYVLIIAFSLSAIMGGVLYITKKIKRNDELPFIPFLALAYGLRLTYKHKGVQTIEMACLMPIILLLITGVILTGFYYHDKNVLYSGVYEVGTAARQMYRSPEGIQEGQLVEFLNNKCKKAFLLFGESNTSVKVGIDSITIEVTASKGKRVLNIKQSFAINDVEDMVRRIKPISEY